MAYCDGIEVRVGTLNKKFANESKAILLNELHHRATELIIKNVLVSQRGDLAYLWITLNPEVAILNPRTLSQVKEVVSAIRTHASVFWQYDEGQLSGIELTKVDVSTDLRGSFIPCRDKEIYQKIHALLQRHVTEVFSVPETNFLALERVTDLVVRRGENVLDSCYQYAVRDSQGHKLLNIKIYDKLLDLLSRNGSHMVGSRAASVLGSQRSLDMFSKRICLAQSFGITRLEISICHDALERYSPMLPSVRTLWDKKVKATLTLLTDRVLNDPEAIPMFYRKLSLPKLMGAIG